VRHSGLGETEVGLRRVGIPGDGRTLAIIEIDKPPPVEVDGDKAAHPFPEEKGGVNFGSARDQAESLARLFVAHAIKIEGAIAG
jgi:hypothetical protein